MKDGAGCLNAVFWIVFCLAVGGTIIALVYNLIMSLTGHHVCW
jgi:hypothetical protein